MKKELALTIIIITNIFMLFTLPACSEEELTSQPLSA